MSFIRGQNNLAGSVLAPIIFYALSGLGVSTTTADELKYPARFAEKINKVLLKMNGDIFWAPASGFTSEDTEPNTFGDEARSVFGPIPEMSCNGENSVSLHLEVNGNGTELLETFNSQFVFRYRPNNQTTKYMKEIERCDKPSLANTAGHACGTSTRIGVLQNDSSRNVDWVILCRKSEEANKLTSDDDYWHPDNPYFALLGIIGFNLRSGEVVFFDGNNFSRGLNKLTTFAWSKPYAPPGGLGYNDFDGRSEAYDTYFHTEHIFCETCHDNKEPWIITPHLKLRGFGYRDHARDENLGKRNILPLIQPRSDDSPYRVIGTRYTNKADLSSKTFRDPTGSCTYCHTLTTGWSGKVLAYDAVGRVNESDKYKSVFQRIDNSRTEWAKQENNTHPWMVPWLGPNVKPNLETGWTPSEIDEENWNRIADCINETSKEDCHYKQVYTSCPAPESLKTDCSKEDELNNICTRLADPFAPSEIIATTTAQDVELDQALPYKMKTTVTWSYLNGLGGVPQRDDVRFNLAIREVEIPDDGTAPTLDDYTSLQAGSDPYFADPDKSGDIHYCDLGIIREKTCHILQFDSGEFFINNISYAGHVRNTTPEPALKPRQYSVLIPTQCNKRYLVRLVPKRFCFDRSGVLASNVDHVKYFDVHCEAE